MLKVVVNALVQAIPSIFNVLLVCLIFWLIFAIMGVQMFAGKYYKVSPFPDLLKNSVKKVNIYYISNANIAMNCRNWVAIDNKLASIFPFLSKCVDIPTGEKVSAEIVPDVVTCLTENNTEWVNSKITFDHVGHAYISLFQVATFKGWHQIMSDAIDSRDVSKTEKLELFSFNSRPFCSLLYRVFNSYPIFSIDVFTYSLLLLF